MTKPRIVIVGAGFGGLFAVKQMKRLDADITLIDRHNYHLFQPLLYQVAAAGLAPSDIAWPIRSILSRQKNTTVLLDEVRGIAPDEQVIQLQSRTVPYDYLLLATGATHSYFGNDDWATHAPGLKSINDATAIRRRLLLAFEAAEMCGDQEQREALLRFVIVGGGPTGVELAGTIAELAHRTLAADFRNIDPRSAQVVLVEAGSRLLPAFSEPISAYAQRTLEKLRVEVRVNTRVTSCHADRVDFVDGHLPTATTLWAAGVAASAAGHWMNAPTDPAGRVIVHDDLSVPDHPNVFVIGDTASVRDADGNPVPGIAPAAKQQGRHVARIIAGRITGEKTPTAFRYRHAGNLATIGRKSAVIEYKKLRIKGLLGWWIWGVAHIYFLVGLPSPLMVTFRWLWEYLTYSRGARLITGRHGNGGGQNH